MGEAREHWDRESTAEFVRRNADLVVARIRRQLGPGARRYFDTQDVYSTVLRRVDTSVAEGKVRATDADSMLGYVLAVARTAVIDRGRAAARLKSLESERADWAATVFGSAIETDRNEIDLDEITKICSVLTDPEDRLILTCWLNGLNHRETGESLGIPWETVRWRWRRIRDALRASAAEVAA